MKYSTEQMMLAATVRDLAVRRRNGDAPRGVDASSHEKWVNEHPIEPYISGVVDEFETIGDMIFTSRDE